MEATVKPEIILDIIRAIFEYIKTLSWPVVVLFMFLILLREIKNLINRINYIKWPGGPEINTKQTKPSKEIPKISEETENKKLEEIKKSSQDKEELLNQVVILQIALHFERTYNLIFGSQIRLLENLRKYGSVGMKYEDVAAYYQGVLVTYPYMVSYHLTQYLDFLVGAKLVEVTQQGDNRVVKIVPLGIDFLEYLEGLNYNKNKGL